jgi:hypothetical protein
MARNGKGCVWGVGRNQVRGDEMRGSDGGLREDKGKEGDG